MVWLWWWYNLLIAKVYLFFFLKLKAMCETLNAYPVIMDSEEENNYLKALINSKYTYTGMFSYKSIFFVSLCLWLMPFETIDPEILFLRLYLNRKVSFASYFKKSIIFTIPLNTIKLAIKPFFGQRLDFLQKFTGKNWIFVNILKVILQL
jgi:hypothetical protein